MSMNDAYFAASGIAYQLGCQNFDAVMPRTRAIMFLRGYLEVEGFQRFNQNAVRALALAACRIERQQQIAQQRQHLERIQQRPCPSDDTRTCKWRKSMRTEFYSTTRPTAFRTEVRAPEDRCGWDLKDGHIGGNFFDYEPCHHPL